MLRLGADILGMAPVSARWPPRPCEPSSLLGLAGGAFFRTMYAQGEAWEAAGWLCHILILR